MMLTGELRTSERFYINRAKRSQRLRKPACTVAPNSTIHSLTRTTGRSAQTIIALNCYFSVFAQISQLSPSAASQSANFGYNRGCDYNHK